MTFVSCVAATGRVSFKPHDVFMSISSNFNMLLVQYMYGLVVFVIWELHLLCHGSRLHTLYFRCSYCDICMSLGGYRSSEVCMCVHCASDSFPGTEASVTGHD